MHGAFNWAHLSCTCSEQRLPKVLVDGLLTRQSECHIWKGGIFNRGLMENWNMRPQAYREQMTDRRGGAAFFLRPYPVAGQHHNACSPLMTAQGIAWTQNYETFIGGPEALFLHSSSNQAVTTSRPFPSRDGHEIRTLQLAPYSQSICPMAFQSHHYHHHHHHHHRRRHRIVPTMMTSQRRNWPRLRILPDDGVALLQFSDNSEVGNYVVHHQEMPSSPQFHFPSEEQRGDNDGVSEEAITKELFNRTYLWASGSRNQQWADSCVICQDDYQSQDKVAVLNCAHGYHAKCLKKWLQVKNSCPICKAKAIETMSTD